MQLIKWAIPIGLGAAAGAVAVMMMPRHSPARRLASDTACRVGSAVADMADMISDHMSI